jgi:hypothetical protein
VEPLTYVLLVLQILGPEPGKRRRGLGSGERRGGGDREKGLPLCDLFFKRAQVKRGKSVRDMREGKGVYKDIKAGLDGRD